MRARARDVFAALVDAVVAPAPPLPPLDRDGAPAYLDRLLAASPRPNAIGLVAALLALDLAPVAARRAGCARRRFRRLSADERRAVLGALEAGRAAPLVQALRGLAHFAYYGEDEAARALGYDADAVLARAAAARRRSASALVA
ncbi:MAG TPA: hypothetical protein VFR97_09980 [Capillimicrobium sp.]|nr:hypothetical protein [Capillimicrobium sp.]